MRIRFLILSSLLVLSHLSTAAVIIPAAGIAYSTARVIEQDRREFEHGEQVASALKELLESGRTYAPETEQGRADLAVVVDVYELISRNDGNSLGEERGLYPVGLKLMQLVSDWKGLAPLSQADWGLIRSRNPAFERRFLQLLTIYPLTVRFLALGFDSAEHFIPFGIRSLLDLSEDMHKDTYASEFVDNVLSTVLNRALLESVNSRDLPKISDEKVAQAVSRVISVLEDTSRVNKIETERQAQRGKLRSIASHVRMRLLRRPPPRPSIQVLSAVLAAEPLAPCRLALQKVKDQDQ